MDRNNRPALARRHRKMILFQKYFRSLESMTNRCMPGLGQGQPWPLAPLPVRRTYRPEGRAYASESAM